MMKVKKMKKSVMYLALVAGMLVIGGGFAISHMVTAAVPAYATGEDTIIPAPSSQDVASPEQLDLPQTTNVNQPAHAIPNACAVEYMVRSFLSNYVSVEPSDEYQIHQSDFEWRIGEDVDGNQIYYRLPVVINGMSWALGIDFYGEETLGWVREDDLQLGMYPWLNADEKLKRQNDRVAQIYETGVYTFPVPLYSDPYTTEQIGVFLITCSIGQGIVHGFEGVPNN